MRLSKFVQYLSAALLTLFPIYVLFRVGGLPWQTYVIGVPAYWLALLAMGALWHRNFEEE